MNYQWCTAGETGGLSHKLAKDGLPFYSTCEMAENQSSVMVLCLFMEEVLFLWLLVLIFCVVLAGGGGGGYMKSQV